MGDPVPGPPLPSGTTGINCLVKEIDANCCRAFVVPTYGERQIAHRPSTKHVQLSPDLVGWARGGEEMSPPDETVRVRNVSPLFRETKVGGKRLGPKASCFGVQTRK